MKSSKYLFSAVLFIFMANLLLSQNSPTLFEQVSSESSGINFSNDIVDTKENNILLYSNYYGGAGVGVGDFNNDGLEDIYFAGNLVEDKIYLNTGGFKFEDYTDQSGIINNDGSWSTSVIVADVNNDGLLDIYVTKELYDYKPNLRKNRLYINQGDAKFKEQAEKFGVDDSGRTRHAAFFDYDNDGYLDLYLLTQPPNPGSYSEYFGTNLLQSKYTSRLYRNEKGRSFKDVTKESGVYRAGFPNAVSASDFNNDGYTDLYIANDFYMPDLLYMNLGNGTFKNIANEALNHMSYYSMGVDVADIDNDDFLDIFVLDMVAEDNFRLKSNMSGMDISSFWNVVKNGGHYQYMFNNFHLNNGNNTYSDVAQLFNMSATDWSWSNLIADFDNDGYKDVYITNGLLRDIRNTDASKAVGDYVIETANNWVKENPNGGDVSIWDILDLDAALALLPSEKLSNYLYRNKGNYKFESVAQDWGLGQKSFSNGAAYADFDNDGDLDIVVNNINEEAFLYKNNTSNSYLRVSLKSKKNTPVFGTRIKAYTKGGVQIIETTNVRGIYSTSEQTVHFGLGNLNKVDKLEVIWPNRKKIVLENLDANQEIELFLEDAKESSKQEDKPSLLFSDITLEKVIDHLHQENEFDDYAHQILLPHKISQFGPALAVGDVNNDGLDDVYVGASVGSSGALYIQNQKGIFGEAINSPFDKDTQREDLDAIFFDIDNDDDKDLYVVSGGNEYEENNDNYLDRVYLNDGKGNFTKANKDVIGTNFSGSVVKPLDFDNDGDLDLFVGGRLKPREYPEPVDSKLFENKGGKLVDVTETNARDLANVGMVTDAVWTDFDNDGDFDLIIVGEWMGITILENQENRFTKKEIESLKESNGWWFSIEKGDFDNDGDDDYILGNLGKNYKYKTTSENPFDVYYEDFDQNGKKDIVLGYYNYGKHYPLRGFSCSSQQVPKLKDEFKKYDVFASLELEEVYGQQNLSNSLHLVVHTFSSSYLQNDGNGNFTLIELPIEAQFSNINDILVGDYNNDGNKDALMVGNLYVSEIETTRNDAGIGVLLLGDGNGNFSAMNHLDSGFFARGDARKIKMLDGNIVLVANNNDLLQVFKMN